MPTQDISLDQVNLHANKADLFANLLRVVLSKEAVRVLDVGCSDGRDYFFQLVESGLDVFGFERDKIKAGQCKDKVALKPHVSIQIGEAERLPYSDEVFDLSVCNDMIYMCNKHEVFSEIFRVLKPGGVLLCLWNQRITCYFYSMVFPGQGRTLPYEWARSAYIIANTLFYRVTGKRFSLATYNTIRELRNVSQGTGFQCEKAWIYTGMKPNRICLILRKSN
ncbi:MAG: class I SAM-dependent methyltransferase [Verrucomicrobiae bacterium]|nr:class I SAM-dependent methyltransferase [Verrucomicrobiae bacterium]